MMRYRFGECDLDIEQKELHRAGSLIKIEPQALMVLCYLIEHRSRLISRRELLDQCWPGAFVTDSALSRCISLIRHAIGQRKGDGQPIQTAPRQGYRFLAEVKQLPLTSASIMAASEMTQTNPSVSAPPSRGRYRPALPRTTNPVAGSGLNARSASRYHREPSLRSPTQIPFIGRQPYLALFSHMLAEVVQGQPRVLFVQGDAGIGKTRLLREFQALAKRQGFATYSGHSHEDFNVPYLPFIEICSSLWHDITNAGVVFQTQEIERIRRLIQNDMSQIGRQDSSAPNQPEQDKLGLCVAVSNLLIERARRQPILISIDDLHWADTTSFDLLNHFVLTILEQSRQIEIPLCVLVNHRPAVSGGRQARHFEIERLAREDICHRLELHGMDEYEIADLLYALGLTQPAPQLLHIFAEITSGSPLFIHEMYYYLMQRQALQNIQGQVNITIAMSDLRLPTQVSDVLLAHTQQLSPAARDTVTLAALIGETFSLQELCAISPAPVADLHRFLEQAVQQRLLLSEGQIFHFEHPLIWQAFYQLPSVARRQYLHGQIARILIDLNADDSNAQCLKIARHLLRAGIEADVEAVVQYVRQAGHYAFSLCNWAYASEAYMGILTAVEGKGILSTAELAELAYLAGVAYARDGDHVRSDAYHDQAVAAYRRIGDLQGAVQALIPKMLRLANEAYGTLTDTRELEALLEDVRDQDVLIQAKIAIALSEVYWAGLHQQQAESMALKGLELAQGIKDWQLCARASFNAALARGQRLQLIQSLTDYQEAQRYAQLVQDKFLEGWQLQRLVPCLVMLGRFDEAQTVASDAYELTAQTMNWRQYVFTSSGLTTMALFTGDFEATEYYAKETMSLVSRYRMSMGGAFALSSLACAHALRGDWGAAESALSDLLEPGHVFEAPNTFYMNMVQMYRELIQSYMPVREYSINQVSSWREVSIPSACDYASLTRCCALVELSMSHYDATHAEQLYHLLAPIAEAGVRCTREWSFFLPRILGIAATLNQWWDKAENHYQSALSDAKQMGIGPEMPRIYLDYAQMLVLRGKSNHVKQVHNLIHQARILFEQFGMKPFVERADRLKETVEQGPNAVDAPPCRRRLLLPE